MLISKKNRREVYKFLFKGEPSWRHDEPGMGAGSAGGQPRGLEATPQQEPTTQPGAAALSAQHGVGIKWQILKVHSLFPAVAVAAGLHGAVKSCCHGHATMWVPHHATFCTPHPAQCCLKPHPQGTARLSARTCRCCLPACLGAEGVLYAEKDFNLPEHPEIAGVPNLEVIKLMQSMKSKELVTERYAWRHFYW